MLELKQMVLTLNGEVPIENLKKGDKVIGKNGEIGQVKEVGIFEKKENKVWYLVNETYAFAPHQSIYASGRLIHARQLNVGMYLVNQYGRKIRINSIRKFIDKSPKIKLRIDRPFHLLNWFKKNTNSHTFYLNGILVHNASRYWVSGTGNWDASDTTHWGSGSGVADGASVPTSSDNVIFDTLSNATAYTCTHQTATVNCADLDLTNPLSGALTFASSGGQLLQCYGSFTIHSAITMSRTATIDFLATSTGKTITCNSITFPFSIRFMGNGGGWTIQDNLTISGTNTLYFNLGTVTFADGNTYSIPQTFMLSGTTTVHLGSSTFNFTNQGWTIGNSGFTLDAGTSQINLASGCTINMSAGGPYTFYNVTFTAISSSGATITGANTFNNLIITGSANKTNLISLANDQTINGALTINGNSLTNRLLIRSNTIGTQRTISAATVTSLTNVDFQDIVATGGGTFSGTSIGDAGNNSGITFTAQVTRYWVAFSGGSWSATSSWSTSNGGGSGASVPLCHDIVNITSLSITSGSRTITADMPRLGKDISFSGVLNTPAFSLSSSGNGVSVFGSLILVSGMTTAAPSSDPLIFEARSAANLTTGGLSIARRLWFKNFGATLTLLDDLTNNSTGIAMQILNGTFEANGKNVTADGINTQITNASPTINMGSGLWTITGSTGFRINTSCTINAQTSTIKFTDSTNTLMLVDLADRTFNVLWFARGASTGTNAISGSDTFSELKDTGTAAHTLSFQAGKTYHITTFTVSGSSGNLITITSNNGIGSDSTSTHALVKDGGGIVVCDWLGLQHSVATPSSTWFAGANSTNNQGVATAGSGWNFTIGTLAITKSERYAVKTTPSAKTKGSQYTIKTTPAPPTKSLKYTVKKAVSITKSLKYTTKTTHAAITKSDKYTVKTTPSAKTKSLQYTIRKTPSITKSLKYTTKSVHAAITKSLKYTVPSTPSAITKGLQYEIFTVLYSREANASLPSDDADLTTYFTTSDYSDVALDDDTRVLEHGNIDEYVIFEFRVRNLNSTDSAIIHWNGQSDIDCSVSTVYLEIFNRTSGLWETIDSDNLTGPDTDFDLDATVSANLSDYYDADNIISCRVYQRQVT